MKLKSKLDYKNVLSYLTVFCLFLVFSSMEKEVYPYSVAAFAALLSVGSSLLITPLLFITSFFAMGKIGLLAPVSISVGFIIIVFLLYKRFSAKIKLELFIYVIISLLGYVFLGDSGLKTALDKRLLTVFLTAVLTPIFQIAFKAVLHKGLKYKLNYEELATVFATLAIAGLGICNALSPEVWKSIAVFFILLFSYFFKNGSCSLISSAMGLSLSFYYGRIEYVSVILVWSVFAECFMPVNRFLSAATIPVSDCLIQILFNIYPEYGVLQVLSVFAGCISFCLIPKKTLNGAKDKLYVFREKQLVRKSINRQRLTTSNRLYKLAAVFSEMKEAFTAFKKQAVSIDTTKNALQIAVAKEVCLNCDNKEKCKQNKCPKKSDLDKLIDIGFAKGKLSLIDMSKDLLKFCIHPNDVLFFLNKSLSEYRKRELENLNYQSEREMLANEAEGISEILRSLALETGTMLKYQNKTEKFLAENLFKKGFCVSEILVYGENENFSVSLVVIMKEFSLPAINKIIDNSLGFKTVLVDKADITEDKIYLSFKKAPAFDAVFGVSFAVKDGSDFSGDTHSVTRICEDKFLIALSDGMGSGEYAQNVSSSALSLIESFYKAGLESNLILSTVNKLLAVNCEDSFTALDVSVVDLKTCRVDFIKYGSPYGFVINQTGIRIIEGNSLPLGILEELTPSVCSTTLFEGDIILLISDGISDAFGSSGDLIEYLKSVPALNPKSLSDGVLEKAISLNGGVKNDDMTALAVRIIKNHPPQDKITI